MNVQALTSVLVIDDHLDLRNAVLNSLKTAFNKHGHWQRQNEGTHIDVDGKYKLFTSRNLAEFVTHKIKDTPRPNSVVIDHPHQLFDPYNLPQLDLKNLLLLIHLNVKTKDRSSRLEHNGINVYEEILARVTCINSGKTPYLPRALFYSTEDVRDLFKKIDSSKEQSWNRLLNLAQYLSIDAANIFWQIPETSASEALKKANDFWTSMEGNNSASCRYATEVTDEILEKHNLITRHSFSDPRRPVVRVILGAIQSGVASWAVARQILEALCESEPASHKSSSQIAINDYPVEVLVTRNKLRTPAEHDMNLVANKGGRTYLIVDDQVPVREYEWRRNSLWINDGGTPNPLVISANDAGWGAALSCIAKSTVVCTDSPRVLDAFINVEGEKATSQQRSWDAVLIDYDLSDTRNGGYYLRFVKDRQFSLPVIMFTGLDDSDIAKWCLSHGASGYFVKEGVESEGRNSLYAFNNLRQLLDFLQLYSPRRIWEEFVGIEKELEEIEEAVWNLSYGSLLASQVSEPPLITWNLRQAFYWLFLANIESLTTAPTIKVGANSDYGSLIGECAASVSVFSQTGLEHLIGSIAILRRNRKETLKDWAEHLRRQGVSGIYGAAREAGLTVKGPVLRRIRSREKDSHLAEPSLTDATNCLESVLTISKNLSGEPSVKALYGNVLSRKNRLNVSNGPRPVWKKSVRSRNHAETSELGAMEIVEGWAELMCPTHKEMIIGKWGKDSDEALNYVNQLLIDPALNLSAAGIKWHESFKSTCKLLLIDDDFAATGWDIALKLLLGADSVTAWTPQDLSTKSGNELEKFDVVLLDLRMPGRNQPQLSPEVGIEILSVIRNTNRSVPIVMLTASDEAYWTNRALRAGAANYFLKRYDEKDKSKTALQLLAIVLELSRRLGRSSSARTLWRDIEQIKSLNPPADIDVKTVKKHLPEFKIIGTDAKSNTMRLNRFMWRLLDRVYDSYLLTISDKFDVNRRIDPDRWLIEGLSVPRFHSIQTNRQLYSLLLALRCGQLVEYLAKLTMLVEFETAPPVKSAYEIINHNLWQKSKSGHQESFKAVADEIWSERNPAAHGFLTIAQRGSRALSATNSNKATARAINCAKEWLLWLGWSV